MPLTARGAPYPPMDGSSPDNVPADIKTLADWLDATSALCGSGVIDNRPAAAPANARTFWLSDAGALSISTGSDWLAVPTGTFLPLTGKAADSDLLDGLDSTVLARKDTGATQTFAGAVNAPSLSDSGQRVYSPVNPPPPGGAVIVQTIRGTILTGNSGPTAISTVTIPAVNPAKTQLRLLGVTTASSSGVAPGHVTLTNSTTVTFTTKAGFGTEASFELTEWS